MINIRIKADLRNLDFLERVIGDRTTSACEVAANALVDDIRRNWSPSAPSSPGKPPAVVTGNLDSSVQAKKQGRDELGRFASRENASVWFVSVDTEEGSNPNDRGQYAAVLEYGMDREFVAPAIERVRENFPFFFKDICKI